MKGKMFLLVLLVLPLLNISAAGQPPAVATQEIMTIDWVGLNDAVAGTPEDSWVGQQIKKKFPNVRIIPNNVDQTNKDKLLLMAAAGELPEFGFIMKIHKNVEDFYDDGIVRSIPWSMIRTYAPNYAKFLDRQPVGWVLSQVEGKEESWALKSLKEYKGGISYIPWFRYDWLQKIGMAPENVRDLGPEDPGRWYWAEGFQYNYDQLEKILIAFRDGDLDGNGKDDTIPAMIYESPSSFRVLAGMFGVTPSASNVVENGKTTFSVITQDWKDFLKTMNKWHENKLVNQDFATLNQEKFNEIKMLGNHGHSAESHVYMHAKWDAQKDHWTQVVMNSKPEAKLIMMDPFIGPTGKTGATGSVGASTWSWSSFVRADVSDEKLAKALEIYDFVSCTVEGHVMSVYGEAGTHFDWFGEPYNSFVQRHDGIQGTGGETGFWFYNDYFRPGEWNKFYDSPILGEVNSYYRDATGAEKYTILGYREDLFKETNYNEVNKKYGATLETIFMEFWFKAMTGALDIDSEWDAYVKMWLKAGGQEMIDEISKAPILLELRKGNKVY